MPDKRQNRRPRSKTFPKSVPVNATSKQEENPTSTALSQNVTGDNTSTVDSLPETSNTTEDAAKKFGTELAWCIEQLHIGIANDKSGSKKAQDAMKILKILENPKAPLVRKRQAMRSTFGDYRKKMDEDEKKYSTNAKKMKIGAVSSQKLTKSVVYKKSHSRIMGRKRQSSDNDSTSADMQNVTENDSSQCVEEVNKCSNAEENYFHFFRSDNSFRFDFQLRDLGGEENVENVAESAKDSEKNGKLENGESKTNGQEPSVNFFKMQPSNEKFAFNFFDSKDS